MGGSSGLCVGSVIVSIYIARGRVLPIWRIFARFWKWQIKIATSGILGVALREGGRDSLTLSRKGVCSIKTHLLKLVGDRVRPEIHVSLSLSLSLLPPASIGHIDLDGIIVRRNKYMWREVRLRVCLRYSHKRLSKSVGQTAMESRNGGCHKKVNMFSIYPLYCTIQSSFFLIPAVIPF